MKKLILVCGPAAIGKSTWSRRYKEGHPDENVFVLSADDTRAEMFGGYDRFPPDGNMMVVYWKLVEKVHQAAKENESLTVILDTTMLYDERRLFFRRHLTEFDFYSLILLKLHDYKECLVRNSRRPKEKFVPEDVILDMAAHYYDPSEATRARFDEVKEVYVD